VFDPVSARIAESLGFEVAMLAGSVASASVLAAPDVMVLTATELADLCTRISRATDLGLIVDADHGFGNALNVMRTVEALETAGIAALTLEDTALPEAYGATTTTHTGIAEMVDRLRAACAARSDPSLALIGRTSALRHEGLEATLERLRAYQDSGVDAIFLAGATTLDEIRAVRGELRLPLVLGITPPGLASTDWLTGNGVCIAFRGHAPFHAAIAAVRRSLAALRQDDSSAPDDYAAEGRSVLDGAVNSERYAKWQHDYLRKDAPRPAAASIGTDEQGKR